MRSIITLVLLVGVGFWLFSGGGESISQTVGRSATTTEGVIDTAKNLFTSIKTSAASLLDKFFDKGGVATTTTITTTQKNTTPQATSTISTPPTTTLGVTKVVVGGVEVLVEVADTDVSREKGLSGRESLPEGKGMLFVFEKPDRYGFWMKDMKFPIDIIWIDSGFRIILIKESVSPSTYPTLFRPTDGALYVLEVPSGFSSKYNLSVGNKIRVIEE